MIAVAQPETSCKICGTSSPLFGVVDFNKSCAETRGVVLPLSGVPIYYHRCPACGFLFTRAMDDWSPALFAERVYNDGYASVDPDYAERRPVASAMSLAKLFGPARETIRILDYGGGNGLMAARLRDLGFDAVSWDPFVHPDSPPPPGPFQVVTSFEVMEHTPDPAGTVAALADLVAEDGLVLFTTLRQPKDVTLSWWYVGPRNGHISLHTAQSLTLLWKPHGRRVGSLGPLMLVAFRTIPPFAAHLFRQKT